MEYDFGSTHEGLDSWYAAADFVFNLVGNVRRIRRSLWQATSV